MLERTAGRKDVAFRSLAQGGTVEEAVPADLVERLCLDDGQLAEMNALAARCERVYGPGATSSGRSRTARCTCCSAAQ